jgi:hypothetical protein
MDAAYSYMNALNLVQGRGFVEDFIWNYLGNPARPPHPSHLYWMPLTSIVAWVGLVVGGATYRAAQIPFVVLSALLAPLSYLATYSLTKQRRPSWLAGLLAIFSGFYFPYWTAIDNFTPFAIAGSLALLFAWRGMALSNWLLVIMSGIFVGLAHLARADGPLLLITIIIVYFLRTTYYAPGYRVSHLAHHGLRFTLYLISGYILVMSPWFIRNWQIVGTPLPGNGSQAMWLTSYDDLFSYGRELSLQTFWAQGIDSILQGRWWVLTTNLQTVLAVWGMIFLTPLAVVGLWFLRHHLLVQLAGLYGVLLFIAFTLVFAFPGVRGGLFHSGAALLPFAYATAMVGLDKAVDWAATHRQTWDEQVAKRFFGIGLVVMAVALSSYIYYQSVLRNDTWNKADLLYPTIAEWLAQQDPDAVVMIGNPPAYRYHGGGLSVVVPNENIETTLQAARHYRVTYLVLDRNRPGPLAEIYEQPAAHPALSLVQTFGQDTGNEIYVFEIIQ